jgi:primosomal protein N'
MLYAQVIVKKKTQVEELTYRIPPVIIPVIQVGSLVTVPLRRQTVPAVVVKFVRTVPTALKPRLREIVGMNKDGAPFSAHQIGVIERLAQQFGASLAEVAYHALGEPNALPIRSLPRSKPHFVQGVYSSRCEYYQKLLNEQTEKRFLFIFAQAAYAEDFFQSLPPALQEVVVLNDQTAGSRKKTAELRQDNRLRALIGTLGSAFEPLAAGDFLVVDQPSHIGSVSGQRPFLSSLAIGQARSMIEMIQLVVGDTLVPIEQLLLLRKGFWQLTAFSLARPPVFVSDRRRSRDIILPSIHAILSERLEKGERVLLLVAARGWATALVCRDCGQVEGCAVCGRTVVVRDSALVCPYCGNRQPKATRCPSCKSANLAPVGEGVSQVVDGVRQFFPGRTVAELSSDQPKLQPRADITVATEKILSFPGVMFDEVIVINMDRLISGSHLGGSYQLLAMLLELQARSGHLSVQTYLPEHPVWQTLGNHQLRPFFQQELTLRRQLKLPPFGSVFRLVGQARSLAELEQQAEAVSELVLNYLPSGELSYLTIGQKTGPFFHGYVQALTPLTLTAQLKRQLNQALPPSWYLHLASTF